jgi:pimeloyl-ACP methyl ester carboxylesterase
LSIQTRSALYAGYRTRELAVAGDGPTCVLLHGFGHPADCWRPVLTRLAAAGRSAVAVDLPGFGRAEDTRRGPKLPQLDAFVTDVVRRHGARTPVTLVGNSLGGLMAVRAASRSLPIAAAVPLAAAGFGWTPAIRVGTIGGLRPIAVLAEIPVPQLIRRPLVDAIVRLLMYGDRSDADPAMIELLTTTIHDRTAARRLMRAAIAYAAQVSTHQRIDGVTCPVTVVHGGRDRIVSLAASRRLHAFIPGSALVVLDKAGHCPQLDAPDTVTELALRAHHTDKESTA